MIGSILGGIFGVASAKKQSEMVQEEKNKNQRWYDKRYNEDSTQRADAQSALTAMRESMRESRASTAGASAVGGASTESSAVEKSAQNNALASTIGGIAKAGESRKDGIEAQFQARDAQISQQQLEAEKAKASAIAQAGAGLDASINSAMSVFGGGLIGK